MKDYLKSGYIIDGVRMDATPQAMIQSAGGRAVCPEGEFEPIVDETIDPSPSPGDFRESKALEYLALMQGCPRKFPLTHPGEYSKACIARALIDTLWQKGHFRLEDLAIATAWKWDMETVGNAAAFYYSVEAVSDYLDSLGVRLRECGFAQAKSCSLSAKASLEDSPEEEEDYDDEQLGREEYPLRRIPKLSVRRKCSPVSTGGPQDWIIFVPFDTCDFRLGGSLLSQVAGTPGGVAPQILDPDYFMDCFEVVRELVEDGIVTAGVTVGDGGILNALCKMMDSTGIEIDLGGMVRSYGESNRLRLLFGEVPGVLLEIRDSDYDYIDAEFLLQDVAYYPLGHPGGGSVRLSDSAPGITGILQSLMDDASEGED